MAQLHQEERSRWLVIRRSFSKTGWDEVVARTPYVKWEMARGVCSRKYGARDRAISNARIDKQIRAWVARSMRSSGYSRRRYEPDSWR